MMTSYTSCQYGSSSDSIAILDGAVVVKAEAIDLKGEPATKSTAYFLQEAFRGRIRHEKVLRKQGYLRLQATSNFNLGIIRFLVCTQQALQTSGHLRLEQATAAAQQQQQPAAAAAAQACARKIFASFSSDDTLAAIMVVLPEQPPVEGPTNPSRATLMQEGLPSLLAQDMLQQGVLPSVVAEVVQQLRATSCPRRRQLLHEAVAAAESGAVPCRASSRCSTTSSKRICGGSSSSSSSNDPCTVSDGSTAEADDSSSSSSSNDAGTMSDCSTAEADGSKSSSIIYSACPEQRAPPPGRWVGGAVRWARATAAKVRLAGRARVAAQLSCAEPAGVLACAQAGGLAGSGRAAASSLEPSLQPYSNLARCA
ncbi:hypothetical protein COO60DRAFT_1646279 [Scenedesmus sp. NREL 46B-D3]|nr:hypothetical protein COO60DRAFT_1646279 [Scenedesmus sp. NREL 46B-D3]